MPRRNLPAKSEPLPALHAEPPGGTFLDEMIGTLRFVAVLVWPDNRLRRREAMASWSAALIDAMAENFTPETAKAVFIGRMEAVAEHYGEPIEEMLATPFAREVLDRLPAEVPAASAAAQAEITQRVFLPLGGFGAVAAAPGLETLHVEMKRAAETGPGLAGLALYTLAVLDRHHPEAGTASLNRVYATVEDTAPGRSIRSLKQVWEQRRVAAHLWAGLTAAILAAGEDAAARGADATGKAILRLLETGEGRTRVLSYAAWFADWGCRHTVPGAMRPVLDGVPLIPVAAEATEPPLKPLGADALARARRYRAPKGVW